MADNDVRRWSLRDPRAEISSNNIPTAMLVQWAQQGIVKPGCTLSADGETWVPAESLPELEMTWYVLSAGRPPYGPVTRAAAEHFIAEGHFPSDAVVSQSPGETPVSAELPLPLELSPAPVQQELEETRKRLVLLERELRLKDRRIDELRQEASARQSELDIEGVPDPAAMARELESLRLERVHLKATAQEAAEASAARERELRQRIHALETALEAAQTSAAPAFSPDAGMQALLVKEADWLRQAQEEEQRLLDQLRELARKRMGRYGDRLAEVRRALGASEAAPLRTAPLPPPPASRQADLEQALETARSREQELQRRLVAQEGLAVQLRAQVSQAERRALDTLSLSEQLRETAQALERERAAREGEHRENAHIQEQLLRRIEELERLTGQGDPSVMQPAAPGAERSSFGWLRKR